LANLDTPQFKRLEVTFQEKLRAAVDKAHEVSPLVRTHPKHYPMASSVDLMSFQPDVRTVTETSGRNDGNNVDLDLESAKLAENTALYNGVADVTSRYLTGLRRAITGGTQ
jgi:flagellar basal-body rod protein FlgB